MGKRRGFFYDGDKVDPYNDLDDWYEEVEHLFWPTLILIGLIMIILIFTFFFIV